MIVTRHRYRGDRVNCNSRRSRFHGRARAGAKADYGPRPPDKLHVRGRLSPKPSQKPAAGTQSPSRAVYTVRFAKAVDVLHVFQKKSPSGIRTARTDVDLIARRLRAAREDYEERYGTET
ncbi:MAG: type II toxin-antitoxin system RelE/ParE family toxin [Burkholderiales bacterium]|nr:type II toxin-antitoxin system RelE/ParE family toxin [Burkholderiales bacterium]